MDRCEYCKYFDEEYLYCWKYGNHVYDDDCCEVFVKNVKKEENQQ